MATVVWSCMGIDKYRFWYFSSDACCHRTWSCSDIYSTSLFSTRGRPRTGEPTCCISAVV